MDNGRTLSSLLPLPLPRRCRYAPTVIEVPYRTVTMVGSFLPGAQAGRW